MLGLQTQSCTDDDSIMPGDDSLVLNSELLGNWAAISYEATEVFYFATIGQVATFNNRVEGFDLDYEITFTEDTFQAAGNYSLAVSTFDVNGSPAGNSTLLQNDIMLIADYMATDTTLTTDSTLYQITIESLDLNEGTVEQTLRYEMNAEETEMTIYQAWEYLREFDNGASRRITVNATSVWEKL